MYHGNITVHIYSIWSLAYRTHSLEFVRHPNDLLCVLFSYNDPSDVFFFIIVWYHFYLSKSSVRPSDLNLAIEKGTIVGIQSGQWGYREDTVRIKGGYSQDTQVVVVVVVVVVVAWWWWMCGGGGGGDACGGGGVVVVVVEVVVVVFVVVVVVVAVV